MESQNPSSETRLTIRISLVLQFAREEALRFNHDYIRTEHILLGIILLDDGFAVEIMKDLGCNLDETREAIEKTFEVLDGPGTLGAIPFTTQAEKALRASYAESRLYASSIIGTEHLLLALLKEKDSKVAAILDSFNVSYEAVNSRLLNQEWRLNPITSPEELQKLFAEFLLSKHSRNILKESHAESLQNASFIIRSEHLLSAIQKKRLDGRENPAPSGCYRKQNQRSSRIHPSRILLTLFATKFSDEITEKVPHYRKLTGRLNF